MIWSPSLGRGDTLRRLPWADRSAAVLAELLLAGPAASSQAGAPPPAAHPELVAALERDPALTLWAACASARQRADLETVPLLAGWLGEHARQVLSWPAAPPGPPDEACHAAAARLAGRSLKVAHLARRLAGAENEGDADQAFALGLLHLAPEWFHLAAHARQDGERRECGPLAPRVVPAGPASLEGLSPAWLVQALDGLARPTSTAERATVQAIENSEAGRSAPGFDAGPLDSFAAETHGWFEPMPGLGRQLPLLAAALGRLDKLEHEFQEQLESEKLEAMAEFAAGAGHEINNPLAVIAGRAQLFLKKETDPERRRELALMNGQAMRIYEMIADMMLFARPPRPRPRPCDLRELIDAMARDLAAKATERNTEFSVEFLDAERRPLVLQCDPDQLRVALRAVCDNSLQALGHGGHLQIAIRHRTADGRPGSVDEIEIVIRDDGPGIAPEVRRHLFDPFYSGRGAGRGLGLGLSKCWRIIRNHGGRIEVDSEHGRGATFRILLPLAPVLPL